MKNRNCPNKDACWDYDASNYEGCAVGEKIARLVCQNKKLKAENSELRARLDKPKAQITYEIVYDDIINKFFVVKCIKKECEYLGNFDTAQEAELKLAELEGRKK